MNIRFAKVLEVSKGDVADSADHSDEEDLRHIEKIGSSECHRRGRQVDRVGCRVRHLGDFVRVCVLRKEEDGRRDDECKSSTHLKVSYMHD